MAGSRFCAVSSLARAEALVLALLLAVLAACTSTPQAPPERDAKAKEFHTHPATAAIYVFRPDTSLDEESVLYIDERLVGSTLPGTYFRIDTRPGKHRLHGIGPDLGSIELDVRPGEVYFIALRVSGGNSHFARVGPADGRRAVRNCCALLENWAPGQRPLLR